MTAVRLLAVLCLAATAADARCRPDLVRFQNAGPHAVARTTRTVVDASRPTPANGSYPGAPQRTLVTEVWRPADGDGAPFPLVVFSHGFGGTRLGQTYLTEHLASHGYVVAALDFPLSNLAAPGNPTIADIPQQPRDVRAVIDDLLAAPELAGVVDPERIGVSGLSWGGLTTLLVAFHRELRDPRIRAALPIAAPACFVTPAFFRGARVPALLLYGETDLIVSFAESGKRAFRAARGRAQLVVLDEASHTGFSAFTAGLPSTTHYDSVACPVLVQSLGDAWNDRTDSPFASLVARRAGVVPTPDRCPVPCEPAAVASVRSPSMAGKRQQDLVRLVATAFFDARLRGDADARCVLDRGLGTLDDVDVRGR